MAKSSSKNLLGMLAFVSVLISAICFILNCFSIGGGLLPTIGYICLLIVVLWLGWGYACHLSSTWRLIYLVIAIVAIAGFVLGEFNII